MTALALGLSLGPLVLHAESGGSTLGSWREGSSRRALVDFVVAVTKEGGPDYVAPADRVAVFDNDGTLWAEQPIYFQLRFVLDRLKALAPEHPQWRDQMPFKAALSGDMKALAAGGEHALLELLMATHAGMTTDEFAAAVQDWVTTTRHPRFGRPCTELVYEPMLELLDYLRANDFKVFIVSGGGIEFMRVFVEEVYGIPRDNVVGSRIKTRYEVRDGEPVLVRLPEIGFIDDKAGKPVGIQEHIGRRPIAAFGNSDGDFQMLEWTTSGSGLRLGLLVHHDDTDREWAYDRESSIGRLSRGLDEAGERGWIVVSMKNDWERIFAGDAASDR